MEYFRRQGYNFLPSCPFGKPRDEQNIRVNQRSKNHIFFGIGLDANEQLGGELPPTNVRLHSVVNLPVFKGNSSGTEALPWRLHRVRVRVRVRGLGSRVRVRVRETLGGSRLPCTGSPPCPTALGAAAPTVARHGAFRGLWKRNT